MFNVYLPKLLEMRRGKNETQTLQTSLWEVVLFTLGGCPGPFVCFQTIYLYSDELTFASNRSARMSQKLGSVENGRWQEAHF